MVAALKLRLFLSRDRRERFTSEGAQVTTGQASTKVILPLAADAVQKILKSPKQYRLPDLPHPVKVVGQVM